MNMSPVTQRGGAQVGWLSAPWPFASIQIAPESLTVNALGKYSFSRGRGSRHRADRLDTGSHHRHSHLITRGLTIQRRSSSTAWAAARACCTPQVRQAFRSAENQLCLQIAASLSGLAQSWFSSFYETDRTCRSRWQSVQHFGQPRPLLPSLLLLLPLRSLAFFTPWSVARATELVPARWPRRRRDKRLPAFTADHHRILGPQRRPVPVVALTPLKKLLPSS